MNELLDLRDTSLLHGIGECNPTILDTGDGSIGPRILKASCKGKGVPDIITHHSTLFQGWVPMAESSESLHNVCSV